MSNTKIDLIKKSHATKPEKLNINVEEEFSNLYISNNKFKRGVRRISHKIHDLFSKENKWGKRPTAQEVTDINERVDKIKKDFEELQTLYNKKIEEIERLENNQDYKNLIEKSKNPDSDENNKTLQEISSKFIYAKDCIPAVLNYIKGLPQSVEEMLSWREYHRQRETWHGRFARQVHTCRAWRNDELGKIHARQTAYIAAASAVGSAVRTRESDTRAEKFIKTAAAVTGTTAYVASGKAKEDLTRMEEGLRRAEAINKETYDTYFKPVVDLKGTFEKLKQDKNKKQETYTRLKEKAEQDYHLLPAKSLENMIRILYQVSATVEALIKEIRNNYGHRLDKGFFMSSEKKKTQLTKIEKNIEECKNLLDKKFADKVKEFTDRIKTLISEVKNEEKLSDSANQEIKELEEFCETVKKVSKKFKEANEKLVAHIEEASRSIYYAYTVGSPISGLILRPDKFPISPVIDLGQL